MDLHSCLVGGGPPPRTALSRRSGPIEMSITGNLRTLEFAELLQWLAQGQKTGALVIDNGNAPVSVHDDQGTFTVLNRREI